MFDQKYKVSDRGALDDLTSFNIEVPKPDALVDIEVALKEYNLDLANITFPKRCRATIARN